MSESAQPEELISLLEKHLIPLWEHVGLDQLAVSAGTLNEFLEQPVPAQMGASVEISSHKPKRHDTAKSDAAALLFVAQGEADFHLGDYALHCPQGHFLLLRPGIIGQHHGRFYLDETIFVARNCKVACFTVLPDAGNMICWLSENPTKSSSKQAHQFCLINGAEAADLFLFSMQEILEKPEGYRKTAAGGLYTFFILVLRELQEGRFHHAARTAAPPALSTTSSPIEFARQYIGNHLNSHLTIEAVARVVFMSRTNFVRRFAEETGQTFNVYIATMRMKEAARMLKEENWQLQIICKHIGLKPAQFRKLFKEHHGISPSEFRRKTKN